MNGGAGLRRTSLRSTDFTVKKRFLDRRDDLAGLRFGQLVGLVVDAIVFVAVEPRLERRRIFS